MSIAEKARLFAISRHGDQKYGEHPYSKHLTDVTNLLKEQGFDEYTVAAGWLHDVIEDTDVTFEDIFDEFGKTIARWVFACTDEQGANRKERHERTYPKLLVAGREAMAVKLADRISNCRNAVEHNHGMLQMYQKEYSAFKMYLHVPGELKEMWAILDVLMQHKIEPEKK